MSRAPHTDETNVVQFPNRKGDLNRLATAGAPAAERQKMIEALERAGLPVTDVHVQALWVAKLVRNRRLHKDLKS